MKWFLLLIISVPVVAKECTLYELKGEVLKKDLRVALRVNKDTNSQREFIFSRKIAFEMGPYFDRTVRGRFITDKFEIVKIEEVNLAVPDPLYRNNEMTKTKNVTCPK